MPRSSPLRPLPLAVRRWLLAVPAVVGLVVALAADSNAALVIGLLSAAAWSWQTDRARDDRTPRGAR